MKLRNSSKFLIVVASIVLLSGACADESETALVPEELSSDSMSTEVDSSSSSLGATTPSLLESSSNEDSSSSLASTTTIAAASPTESEDGVNHHEEPKLPVDLLSEDILLDPNIVLARLARDVQSLPDSSRYNEYYYHPRQNPSRRIDQAINFRSHADTDQPNLKKPRIYPVFPGKKWKQLFQMFNYTILLARFSLLYILKREDRGF